jgi:aldose 1-epimerase
MSKLKTLFVFPICALLLAAVMLCLSCGQPCSKEKSKEVKAKMNVQEQAFGQTPDGHKVKLYILTNSNGLKARIMTYGAAVVSLEVPDRNGKFDDITLGYDNLDGYVKNNPYFGVIVGRYGNRIAKGRFTLDGTTYKLATNNGENHLHGGIKGFDKVVWDAESFEQKDAVGVKLTYLSKDGEEGYPGNLKCSVTYTLTNNDELKISYEAETDKATVINLTHHSYFNLAGQGKGDILGHELMINADKFTPTDKGSIPTGALQSVKGTPMDFTKPCAIGARINDDFEQLRFGKGYDHNWVLNKKGKELTLAARAYEPNSGRVLEIYTTEPGVQFYSGNFLDGSITGKQGKVYKQRYGFCLETQHFPDSPNKPQFPSTILRPGQKYTQLTVHKFYTR